LKIEPVFFVAGIESYGRESFPSDLPFVLWDRSVCDGLRDAAVSDALRVQ